MAFQVTADVLDYRAGTGKTPGADLRERKVTLPLLYAMESLPGLREELQASAPTPEQLPLLMKRIEQTGALDRMLEKIADFYEEETDVAVAALTSLLEPIMMVVVGGLVGVVLVAMYMPIFELAGNIKAE